MTDKNNVRASLEKFFAGPFSEYQWGLIAAQGYEDAVLSGARTAEDVAAELKSLIEAAGKDIAGGEHPGSALVGGSQLTWDQMERLVLGRALAKRETNGPRLVLGTPVEGERIQRLFANRKRNIRLWSIGVGSIVVVIAIALVAGFALGGFECGAGGVTTSDGAQAQVGSLTSSTTTTEAIVTTTLPEVDLPDYTADLICTEMVPPVSSEACGTLELTLSEDGQAIEYVLSFESIDSLTIARLRTGAPGENGEELFTVYPGPTKQGLFTGIAAEGSFGADDLLGPLRGQTVADFCSLVEDGLVYLIVGTSAHRNGELRGQVQ